jgi:hypothetical protein
MEETTKKDFRYTLKWSGRNDSPVVQMAFAYCKKEIPICKDVCEFIDYNRYVELIAAGEIEEPRTYWKIEEGQVGMIAHSGYVGSYAMSWENLSHCYRDFMAGYDACEKGYKFLRDWDAAIEHEAKRAKYMKKCKRTFSFNVDCWDDHCYPIYDPQASKVTTRSTRGTTWKFTVTDVCTGPELEYLVYNICSDCRILMPMMEEDPRKGEAKPYPQETWSGCKKKYSKVKKA